MKACVCRGEGRWVAGAALLAVLLSAAARGDEEPVAKITVSSATSGLSLGSRLVEGVMTFRGGEYLLTLRGVAESASTVGSVRGLLRPRDVEGTYCDLDCGPETMRMSERSMSDVAMGERSAI